MIRRYEECFDVLYVLVRLYLVVFHFTWFLSAGHLDCGCMCQTTLIKSLSPLMVLFSEVESACAHTSVKKVLSSCLDFFMVIMVVDFHGIVIVMPQKSVWGHIPPDSCSSQDFGRGASTQQKKVWIVKCDVEAGTPKSKRHLWTVCLL